ncbi:MAG: hypothetical protein J7K54_04810 [Candidatus Aenigmarchaeota archaeon]|nr:hypothetical protein [Candidatus Aenigmarchaeota archaeon]
MSWRDLYYTLKIYGIEDPNLKSVWSSMTKPVSIKMPDSFGMNTWRSDRLLRIEKVWTKGRTKFVLWNSRELEISKYNQPRYRHFEDGFYEFDGIIIRTKNLGSETVRKIKAKSKTRTFNMNYWPIDETAMDEDIFFDILESPSGKNRKGTFTEKELKVNMRLFERLRKNLLHNKGPLKMTRKFFIYKGRKYGIENTDIVSYVNMGLPSCFSLLHSQANVEYILKSISENITNLQNGRYKMILGDIYFWFEVKKNRFFIDGREIDTESLGHLIMNSPDIKSRKELLKMSSELSVTPIAVKRQLERGLLFSARGLKADGDKEFHIKIAVSYEQGKMYAVSPLDGKTVPLKYNVSELDDMFFRDYLPDIAKPPRWLIDHFEVSWMFRRLSSIFGKKDTLKIMELARENAAKAKRNADRLLREFLEKHRDRIKKDVFDGEEGYIVKGEIRNYFISNDTEVRTFPAGGYICIEEDDRKKYLVNSDRLLSQMLLLLNDTSLKAEVETLSDEGNDEVIIS